MEIDLSTRIGIGIAGLLVILLMNTDVTYLVSKLVFWKNSNTTTSEKEFLNMINLWYKLKASCEKNNFIEASNKLDEVFPLLNRSSDE